MFAFVLATVLPLFAPDRFTVLNIAPCSVGEEKKLASEMIEYRNRTGNDIVLYSLSLHPSGRPAMDNAMMRIGSYRTLKKELEGSGIRLGVLIQSILGHWPRVEGEEEPWMRSITLEGKPKRYCPLEPGYRRYIHDVVVEIAKERPCFIMIDDDVHASGTFGVECFCERHMAKFNKANGTKYTADSLRTAVNTCASGDALCVSFIKMQREFVNDVADLIRASIDEIDPSIPAAASMPTRERRFAHETAGRIAASGQGRVLRIANAIYGRRGLGVFTEFLAFTLAMRDYNRDVPFLIDESDTYPHNRWSLSASVLDMKLQAAAFCGLKGSKFWFCNAHKGAFPISRAYTDKLAEHRGLYSAIAAVVDKTEVIGVAAPVIGGRSPWHPKIRAEEFAAAKNWVSGMAGVFGVPFICCGEFSKDRIYALSGEAEVNALSDAEIGEIFKHRVLADGAAAIALTKRGFSSLTGVKAHSRDMRYNFEFGADGRRYPFSKTADAAALSPVDASAEVVTWLGYKPKDLPVEKVSPAMLCTTNALGGRTVATVFGAFGTGRNPSWTDMRKAWFLLALSKLGWNGFAVMNDQEAAMLERKGNGAETLLAVFNTGFDEIKPLLLRTPGVPKRIEKLSSAGVWQNVEFRPISSGVEIDVSLPCANACILRMNCK